VSSRGSLTVAGVGISVPAHVTTEARLSIQIADEVLYLVTNPVAVAWVESQARRARSLEALYEEGQPRKEAYEAMVDEILAAVRKGSRVCAVFYGHPGVFVTPSHEAVRRARDEGFEARMLPGISAEDCLFAALGVDPSRYGCQSFEATDLIARARPIDPSAALIVWQIGVVGNLTFVPEGDLSRLGVLVDYLLQTYPEDHEVVAYEASLYSVLEDVIVRCPLESLADMSVSPAATLYVPPAIRRGVDRVAADRLFQEAAISARI
jgi:uncharacterized protein YabN with tetrapyrrole methylase and pyrophosphatase domain